MPTELKSSAFESDEAVPQQQAAAGLAAEFALVRAALDRIEAAARADRATLEALRGSLGDMARTIGRAKAAYAIASDSADTTALLDELEHLVDTMIEAAGGGAAPAAETAEPVSVPTVSGVVAQLGPTAGIEDAQAAQETHEAAVFELKAMLAAMNAATVEQTAAPEPGAEAEPASQPEIVVELQTIAAPDAVAELQAFAAPEPVAEMQAIAEAETAPQPEAFAEPELVAQPDAFALPEAAAPPEAAAEAVPQAPVPDQPAIHEDELLASFERMGAVPILPPEEGTAVIFPKAADPEFARAPALPAPQEIWELSAPESNLAAMTPLAEPTPVAEPEASSEAAAPPDAVPVAATTELETAAPAAVTDIAPSGAPAAAATEPAPAIEPPEPDFDPSEFLFGPEPDDPAAFLLEPAPIVPPAPLPRPDFVSAPSALPSEEPPQAADVAVPAEPPRAPVRDPLHALKAMSEWERLALFS